MGSIEYKESIYNLLETVDKKNYIFNAFAHSIIEVYESEKEKILKILKNENVEDMDDYKSALIDEGFMIDSRIDEKKLIEFFYLKNYFNTENLKLTLIPTMMCNLSCPYCFESEKSMKWDRERVNTIKKFINIIMVKKKNVHLSLFGGEPLLEFKKVEEVLKEINKSVDKYDINFSSSITTNGVLLTTDIINKLVDQYSCDGFQLTIDGNKETNNALRTNSLKLNTYDIIVSNFIKLIRKNTENNLSVILRVNLFNNSLEDIESLLNEFKDEDKKKFSIYFRPIYNTDRFNHTNSNTADIKPFYELAISKGFKMTKSFKLFSYCEGDLSENNFTVMPDLQLYKCINHLDFEPSNIGKINPDGDYDLKYNNLVKWFSHNPFNDSVCNACDKLPLCWGGCPVKFLKNKERTCYYEKGFEILSFIS
jgi:uncharacterized protein